MRSETQATDSTCMGWTPNSSAVKAATASRRPESRAASQKTSSVASVCSSRFVRMNGRAESGSPAFHASESMVSGW